MNNAILEDLQKEYFVDTEMGYDLGYITWLESRLIDLTINFDVVNTHRSELISEKYRSMETCPDCI